jgi:hypothetical protein
MALQVVDVDPDQLAEEWLFFVDASIVGCRGQGHAFPKIKSAKLNPRQSWLERNQRTGRMQLVQLCRDGCGSERYVTTNDTGTDIDLPATFRYRRRKKNYSPPRGARRVSRRECFAETMRRRRLDMLPGSVVPEVKLSTV